LFSTSPDRIERAKRGFHVGNLYINRKITGALVGIQPFGGFNMSGSNAKAGGPDYLRLFMEMKTVAERL
jgi:1-pyrroline-5-carboxylate dehydrogenase